MSMINKYLEEEEKQEEIQETFDELRLKQCNNRISKNHKSFKKFTTK